MMFVIISRKSWSSIKDVAVPMIVAGFFSLVSLTVVRPGENLSLGRDSGMQFTIRFRTHTRWARERLNA